MSAALIAEPLLFRASCCLGRRSEMDSSFTTQRNVAAQPAPHRDIVRTLVAIQRDTAFHGFYMRFHCRRRRNKRPRMVGTPARRKPPRKNRKPRVCALSLRVRPDARRQSPLFSILNKTSRCRLTAKPLQNNVGALLAGYRARRRDDLSRRSER